MQEQINESHFEIMCIDDIVYDLNQQYRKRAKVLDKIQITLKNLSKEPGDLAQLVELEEELDSVIEDLALINCEIEDFQQQKQELKQELRQMKYKGQRFAWEYTD